MMNPVHVCMCACEVWGEVCGMRVEMMVRVCEDHQRETKEGRRTSRKI